MKVVHLDTGRDWRGGQAQVSMLIQRLRGHGVANVLLAPAGPLLARAAGAGVPVHEWRARGDLDLPALAAARAHLAAERPDLVHLHSARAHAIGAPAARLAGVPAVVVSRRVVRPPGRDPWSKWKYGHLVDRYLCVSAAARDPLIAAGVDPGIVRVVPSGVPVAELRARATAPPTDARAADLRAALGWPPETPVLGTVAALTEEKGHAMLLAVAQRLAARDPQPGLVWVGEGAERGRLERERDRLGLAGRVALLGAHDDVPALVRQFTLLLVGSQHEGFCTAAVEAMALGVPVVATAVGGIPEVVEDGVAGRLVPAEDDAAMAACVASLLDDPALRRRLGRGAAEAADRFDADLTAARTLGVYRELTRAGQGS